MQPLVTPLRPLLAETWENLRQTLETGLVKRTLVLEERASLGASLYSAAIAWDWVLAIARDCSALSDGA